MGGIIIIASILYVGVLTYSMQETRTLETSFRRKMAYTAADIVRMAGQLNRHGKFGEIREGWVADLLLHNGDVLADLSVLADPETNLALIMKAGEIIKAKY